MKDVNEPYEIVGFRDRIVEEIKTGSYHTYVKCNGDEHWFFGDNNYGQCMAEGYGPILTPQLFDSKDMKIENVFLGNGNTKFIVSEN